MITQIITYYTFPNKGFWSAPLLADEKLLDLGRYTHYIVIMLTSVLHFATRRIIFNIIYLYIKLYNFLLGEICNVRCPDYTYITFYSCTVP